MSVLYSGKRELTKELFYEQLVSSPPSEISLDVETISLVERQPIGFAIATAPDEAWYFTTYPEMDKEVELIWPLLNNPDVTKVFFNAPFDINEFAILHEIDRSNIADVAVMAHLLNRGFIKLSMLAPEIGRETENVKDMLGPRQNMLDLPHKRVADKCINDATVTLGLYQHYKPRVDWSYFKTEMEVVPILIDMSNKGMRVDQELRGRLEAKFSKEVDYYKTLCDGEGFSPSSNQQVGYILAKRGNFLPFTKGKNGRRHGKNLSVSASVLELIDDPIAAIVINFRKANTLLNRYIKPLAGEDRIFTEYNLDAITGRISSANRNLQNIPPGEVRNMFLPDGDHFTNADYSQEELRILAHLSEDREMMRAYENHEDIHQLTADMMRIPRKIAKNTGFAMIYGATAQTIRSTAKIRDIRMCYNLLDKWFKAFRGAAEWIKGTQNAGLRNGYIETMFGRRIELPVGYENDEAIKRKAVNYTIQGTGAEIMKRALIKCKKLPLVVTVHDSMLFEGDVRIELSQLGLDSISPVCTPLDVKLLEKWE